MQPGSSPLDQLADIHLPDSVSWWPLAPGWWILIALFIAITVGLFFWRKRKVKRRYRHHAITLLQQAYAQYQRDQQAAVYLQQASELLRRVARTSYGSTFDASIKGDAWLHWLDQTCPTVKQQFANGSGQILLTGPYQKNPQVDVDQLHKLCLEWIQHHNTNKTQHKELSGGVGQHV